MWEVHRKVAVGAIILAALALQACNSTGGSLFSFGDTPAEIELPATVEPYPDAEVLTAAKTHFAQGNYGHAARYYERAVEVAPSNGETWLGLAASYDRVRRFELADRAYREAARLIGGRAEYYNNIGYSYLLRGDTLKARDNFLRARELDPVNPTINNNLEMLRDNTGSSRPS
jgi:Flp pilus assembly protein TadD